MSGIVDYTIKTIVFDLDGTLVDTVDLWARVWAEAFEKYGIALSIERARMYVGLPASRILADITGKSDPHLESNILEYRKGLMWKYSYMAKPFKDVLPALDAVRSMGSKIIVASSAVDEWIAAMLDRAGIKGIIDGYISGTMVKNPKPAPDVFAEAFKIAGTDPKEGIVVGDRESDTVPAMQIGAIAVLIDRRGEFENARANFVIHDMGELEAICKEYSKKQ